MARLRRGALDRRRPRRPRRHVRPRRERPRTHRRRAQSRRRGPPHGSCASCACEWACDAPSTHAGRAMIDAPMIAGLLRPVDPAARRSLRDAARSPSSGWRSATSWCTCGAAISGSDACRRSPNGCSSSIRSRSSRPASTCSRARRPAIGRCSDCWTPRLRTTAGCCSPLGVSPMRAGLAAAGSSRSFSNLKRRIAMLGHRSPSSLARVAGWLLAGAAVCALVPIQLAARSVVDVAEARCRRT